MILKLKQALAVWPLIVSECKERWKNLRAFLRAVYIRHNIRNRHVNGTANRKPYYLEDAMEFTMPYIKTLNASAGNTSTSFEVVYDDQDEDNSSNRIQSPENAEVALPPSPQPNHLSQLNQPKKRPNEDLFLQEYFRSKMSRVQDNVDTQREANALFLLSLLPDLNDMSSQQVQVRTFKRKVLELIDEVLVTKSPSIVKAEQM